MIPPQLPYEERPQLFAVILLLSNMLRYEPCYHTWVKYPLLSDSILCKHIQKQWFKLLREPCRDWHAKTLFFAAHYAARQFVFHEFFEQMFCMQPFKFITIMNGVHKINKLIIKK